MGVVCGIMAPQRYLCPNPWNLRLCYAVHSKRYFADVIKIMDVEMGRVA